MLTPRTTCHRLRWRSIARLKPGARSPAPACRAAVVPHRACHELARQVFLVENLNRLGAIVAMLYPSSHGSFQSSACVRPQA
jgi:hypothetical protein